MKARPVKKLDPAAPAGRERGADRQGPARGAARLHAQGARPRPDQGPARHADRGQAASLRAGGDGLLLRAPRRHRPPPRPRPPGHPRRDARLRRDAAAGAQARRGAAGPGRRGGPRRRPATTPDLDPRLAAKAPHRTAYRGLDVLAVYLRARRELLFDRFVAFWARQEETGTWLRLERAVDAHLRKRHARRAKRGQGRRARGRRAGQRGGGPRSREADRAGRAGSGRADRAAAQITKPESRPQRAEPRAGAQGSPTTRPPPADPGPVREPSRGAAQRRLAPQRRLDRPLGILLAEARARRPPPGR